MADKKISQLVEHLSIENLDILPVVNSNETKKIKFENLTAPLQLRSEKNQSNGYAGLDNTAKVGLSYLPDFAFFLKYTDFASLPVSGAERNIYLTEDDNKLFYWDGLIYVEMSIGGATPTLQDVTDVGNITTNSIEALSFVKTGGLGTGFLKADGTVDSNTYQTEITADNGLTKIGDIIKLGGNLIEDTTITGGPFKLINNADIKIVDSKRFYNDTDNTGLISESVLYFPNLNNLNTLTWNVKRVYGIGTGTYLEPEAETYSLQRIGEAQTLVRFINLSIHKQLDSEHQFLAINGISIRTNNYYGYLKTNNITNNRILEFPDSNGTIALTDYVDGKVADSITDGITTIAPSQNAVFDALALKQNLITLTTTGTSGASSLIANTLNIPQYSGTTDLSYTPSPTNGIVVSSTGTDATIPLADGTNAGLITPAEKTKLSNTSGTNTGDQTITLTSDVTGTGTSSFATTISSNVVTNTKLAQMAVNTIKGRVTAGTGDPEDLTATQVRTILNIADGAKPKPTLNKTFTLDAPTSSDDITIFRTDVAITIVQVIAVSTGTTPSTTYQLMHGTDRDAAGTAVTTSSATTSKTTGNTATLSGGGSVPADSWVWFESTAASGTTVRLTVDIRYTED